MGIGGTQAAKQAAALQMVQTAPPIANCPARRRSALFSSTNSTIAHNAGGVSNPPNFQVARTDYAANTGDAQNDQYWSGPTTDPGIISWPPPTGKSGDGGTTGFHPTAYQQCTGIVFECSIISNSDVTDGAANTILFGEKSVDTSTENTGKDPTDNENMYVGFDNDINRCGWQPSPPQSNPELDQPGAQDGWTFGSAHPNGCNFVMCDGSLRFISYLIDPTTFQYLCNRADGQAVDINKTKQ